MRAKLTQIAGLIALTILVGWAMAQLQGCGHTDTDQDSHVYCSLYPEDQTVDACHDSPQVAAKVACKEQDVDRYEPLYIAVCTPPVSTGERFDETSCDRLYWTGAMSRREVCETPTYE